MLELSLACMQGACVLCRILHHPIHPSAHLELAPHQRQKETTSCTRLLCTGWVLDEKLSWKCCQHVGDMLSRHKKLLKFWPDGSVSPTQNWSCRHLFVSACDNTHIFLPKKDLLECVCRNILRDLRMRSKYEKKHSFYYIVIQANLLSHRRNHEHQGWPSKPAISSLMFGFPAIHEDRYPKINRCLCVRLGASWFVSGLFWGGSHPDPMSGRGVWPPSPSHVPGGMGEHQRGLQST